jgi:hypothetical protein
MPLILMELEIMLISIVFPVLLFQKNNYFSIILEPNIPSLCQRPSDMIYLYFTKTIRFDLWGEAILLNI